MTRGDSAFEGNQDCVELFSTPESRLASENPIVTTRIHRRRTTYFVLLPVTIPTKNRGTVIVSCSGSIQSNGHTTPNQNTQVKSRAGTVTLPSSRSQRDGPVTETKVPR